MTAGTINTDHRRASGMQYPFSNQQLSPSLRVLPLVVPSSMIRKICQSRGSSSACAEHAHWRGKSLTDCAVLDAVDPGTCIYVDITERRTLRNC